METALVLARQEEVHRLVKLARTGRIVASDVIPLENGDDGVAYVVAVGDIGIIVETEYAPVGQKGAVVGARRISTADLLRYERSER